MGRLVYPNCFFNDHIFYRHVLVAGSASGLYAFDFVNYVHTVSNFGENGIAPALHGFAAVVQKVVIFNINEELRAS